MKIVLIENNTPCIEGSILVSHDVLVFVSYTVILSYIELHQSIVNMFIVLKLHVVTKRNHITYFGHNIKFSTNQTSCQTVKHPTNDT